jgi:ATP-dependent helicase/nuclease subunit B
LTTAKFFPTGAALQDYLLEPAGLGTLAVIPHQRLAHQIWHRQRLAALAAGRSAWEPPALHTLNAWWSELYQGLWPQETLAPPLVRLALWRQALKAAPPPDGPTSELTWAQALDEAHILLCRHGLPLLKPKPDDSPLVAWRRRVSRVYADLLRQGAWISPGELPAYLTAALREGRLNKLPPRVLLVGMETPAPLEDLWLQEVNRHTRLVRLQVRGDPKNVQKAVVLPDPGQELDWVAAQLVELAHRDNLPLHRLAVTAMAIDTYTPNLRRVLAELLGPPQTSAGWAYNFSQGPNLAEAPLFQAALLPLIFIAARERREDLVSLLLSPYYGEMQVHGHRLALWDRIFREQRVDQGWEHLKQAVLKFRQGETETLILQRLDRVWSSLNLSEATAEQWGRRLQAAWQELGFPRGLSGDETEAWARLAGLRLNLEAALGSEGLGPGEFLEWLTTGARRIILPGPGIQAAGLQVLGLLEMRGLDFDRVFCLGMNSGTLPAPPRPLPLLSAGEKRLILGGTYESQHHFAAELFANLLGTVTHLTLTRPKVVDQEERVGTPLYLGEWGQAEMAVLSVPDPAWLRSAAIQAAFYAPETPSPDYQDLHFPCPLPGQISLSQISTALGCPCRFLLEVLLKIRELPEIEAGLDPRERGRMLHQVLARFTTAFREALEPEGDWDPQQAREILRDAVDQLLAPLSGDLHWQAELDRWLGDHGLLWEWLRLERERFEQGWRWQGCEVAFQDLREGDWPFTLAGRIDRLDFQPDLADLVVWDYKSGEIPKKVQVLDDMEDPQLPCYLLAVRRGRVPGPWTAANLRAGFIGLKSPRAHHLKHEDFGASTEQWQQAAKAFARRVADLGRRLAAGDFRPDPTPAPEGNKSGACQYCPYGLVCGFTLEPTQKEEL